MRRLPDSFHAAGFCCPWWIPEHMIKPGHPILKTKAPEGDSLYYSETLEYQMLGALFMSALRPDNVMHPHLRCHFEFHVGKLLSLEFFRNTFYAVTVMDFLAGCGVQFKDGSGWLEEKLLKRTRVGTDALTLYAHSIWGEKCRVQRYIDADADIIYLIATALSYSENVSKPSAVVWVWLHLQWIPWFHGTLRQTVNVSCLTVPRLRGR